MQAKLHELEGECEMGIKRNEYNETMENNQNWTREIIRKEFGDLQVNISKNEANLQKNDTEVRGIIEDFKINTVHRITECESTLKTRISR